MLLLFSLLATFALAQDCDVSGFAKPSQKRRECAKRTDCDWKGRTETTPGNFIEGTCSSSSSCASLNQNRCKKRNTCYINWTKVGQPCEDYNPNQAYPCSQLSGKRNQKKCAAQPLCINGSGDRQNKLCLDLPADIENQDCGTYSNKPNKNLCNEHSKCEWVNKDKLCIPKKELIKTCPTIFNQNECVINHSGCKWVNNLCVAMGCAEITDRTMCNASKNVCSWYQGFNADDFDPKKNKNKQRNDPNNQPKFDDAPKCRDGFKKCSDIMVENHCKLAESKYGINNCHWNAEAKEIPNANRCDTIRACKDYTDSTECQLAQNMQNDKCVWQKSGAIMRCMEFACDSAALDTKNKCNTVGCHWHRNKDKRDPESEGYCGVFDLDNGRRL